MMKINCDPNSRRILRAIRSRRVDESMPQHVTQWMTTHACVHLSTIRSNFIVSAFHWHKRITFAIEFCIYQLLRVLWVHVQIACRIPVSASRFQMQTLYTKFSFIKTYVQECMLHRYFVSLIHIYCYHKAQILLEYGYFSYVHLLTSSLNSRWIPHTHVHQANHYQTGQSATADIQ